MEGDVGEANLRRHRNASDGGAVFARRVGRENRVFQDSASDEVDRTSRNTYRATSQDNVGVARCATTYRYGNTVETLYNSSAILLNECYGA